MLQLLQVPHKHWFPAVDGTVLASFNTFDFLHRVHLGGLSDSQGRLLGTGLVYAELELRCWYYTLLLPSKDPRD